MRYVLDCSVAVKSFVPEPLFAEARLVLGHLRAGEIELIAPESIVAEHGHALRKLVLARKLHTAEAPALIKDFLRSRSS